MEICPSCNKVSEDDIAFVLKPPTAGRRILDLRGTNAENLTCFLSDLKRKIGCLIIPLHEHFDLVVASELGTTSPGLDSTNG